MTDPADTPGGACAINARLIIHGHVDGRCIDIEHDMPPLSPEAPLRAVADAALRHVQRLTDIAPTSVYVELVLMEPTEGDDDGPAADAASGS